MPTFGKKRSYIDLLYTKPVLFVLGLFVLFMGIAVFERFGVEREMHARRIAAEEERQKALERQAALEEEVMYLEGERGIEEEIRKHFDVAREGETVVILMGDTGADEAVPVEVSEPEPKWYQFWR